MKSTKQKPSLQFLLLDLEDLLGFRVDVVTEGGLKPRIKERVLKEAITL